MTRPRTRSTLGLLLVAGLGLALAGCGGDAAPRAGGKVKISINGQPPGTQAFERKIFDEDVAAFEAANPGIDIEPHEGFMDPKTFSAKLSGGQLEDVFYVYFTDPAQIIARRQAADITDHLKDVPLAGELNPQLTAVFKNAQGRQFGLPTANYSMGLLYNRTLFTKAGLDPDKPPATWSEVREAAKKISALGGGTVGFGELSKNNQGGWHLTSWLNSMGANVARKDGETWKADFNNDKGKAALQALRDMRWTDDSMGSKQLLEIPDLQQLMGAGQLGMYIAAPDNVPTLVNQFKGKYEDYGLAPMPGGQGTLIGGEGYMFNPKASPEKIKAGLTWLRWKYLDPTRTEANLKRYAEQKQPIGLPVPPAADVWVGPVREQQEKFKAANATIPVGNYQPYINAAPSLKGNLEPPNAQQVYAALDTVMQGVLTNKDANLDQLLADAESKVNGVLAQVR
ncbi:ABC-type glycerol-3-phosphate transport system substrate-binding protein [Crossiella equi]|uniref:ABC-type glycerol-3-phosphate transport system substrate-binding protein n=1 Tax=Crossiella equi TaxID=130796 RepID=A0ABS5AN63_9PSEU|nr:extracellular solute-binding protein [Crossiella equi]MBP2478006.1 ABC-type glycerol-3-phosphate transport system substrate-binding protein [Crossiella equi]